VKGADIRIVERPGGTVVRVAGEVDGVRGP
jgi:hypothetical protein